MIHVSDSQYVIMSWDEDIKSLKCTCNKYTENLSLSFTFFIVSVQHAFNTFWQTNLDIYLALCHARFRKKTSMCVRTTLFCINLDILEHCLLSVKSSWWLAAVVVNPKVRVFCFQDVCTLHWGQVTKCQKKNKNLNAGAFFWHCCIRLSLCEVI